RLSPPRAPPDAASVLPHLPTDLDGTARPQGPTSDMGVYEFVARGPSPTPTVTPVPATATRTRTVTATMGPPASSRIAGTLRYYRGDRPVAGATVTLDGPAARSVSSDAAGAYQFTAVPNGA